MPTSKALQRFQDRVRAFSEDLELADLLVKQLRSLNDSDKSICEELAGQPDRHERLHARRNTAASRGIISNHFRRTIQSAFIKDLHEDFSEYLATSLGRAALTEIDPNRYTGEVKIDIKASELLAAGSWESVVSLISSKIFRALENEKSTRKLIKKISDRVGLELDDAILDTAMPYLDARHILVHADGIADVEYKTAYPDIELNDDKLSINFTFVTHAKDAVHKLACHIDEQFLDKGLVPPAFISGPAPEPE
ncbi:hypothetical protein [Pseudodonghicola xiamenensis]|uniref:RiboL-PSP-HEPN domain-containing protein n=1 Tax=Pseudodonghicola xiamenensis TaxID=337702 RepID=A0A8J3MC14_9RHOB|nr:hypothetical protein [Pseudodonghicola xiamenensis]GHG82052.1 hypothetical protein GCM10010961_06240 [Pseudodonghicola xiamenensis]